MSIPVGESIPRETHAHTDQFIRIESGSGEAVVDGKSYPLKAESAILIPAGSEHQIFNRSDVDPLKLYTIYGPPEHRPKLVLHSQGQAAEE
jgi:mannose-6-phosphate isomerase-like protein (cupin superfamily)